MMNIAIENDIVNGVSDLLVIREANVMNNVIYAIGDSFNAFVFSESSATLS